MVGTAAELTLMCTDCFIGLTEEQIIDIFSSAGKVLNFRLVYDRETGRPKGFGFAEYPDSGMRPLHHRPRPPSANSFP